MKEKTQSSNTELYQMRMEVQEKEETIKALLAQIESYKQGGILLPNGSVHSLKEPLNLTSEILSGLKNTLSQLQMSVQKGDQADPEGMEEVRTLLDVAKEKGLIREDAIEKWTGGDEEMFVDELLQLEGSSLDEKSRMKRIEALRMLEDEQKNSVYLRTQKARLEFLKLRERFRIEQIKEKINRLAPQDKNLTFLQRMEKRYSLALVQWERKKQLILEERKSKLLSVLSVFNDIVVYKGIPKIDGTKISNPESRAADIRKQTQLQQQNQTQQSQPLSLQSQRTATPSTPLNITPSRILPESQESKKISEESKTLMIGEMTQIKGHVSTPNIGLPMYSAVAGLGALKTFAMSEKEAGFADVPVEGRALTPQGNQKKMGFTVLMDKFDMENPPPEPTRKSFIPVGGITRTDNPRLVSLLGSSGAQPDLVFQPLELSGTKISSKKPNDGERLLNFLENIVGRENVHYSAYNLTSRGESESAIQQQQQQQSSSVPKKGFYVSSSIATQQQPQSPPKSLHKTLDALSASPRAPQTLPPLITTRFVFLD